MQHASSKDSKHPTSAETQALCHCHSTAPPHPPLRTRSLGCEEQEAEGVIMQAQAQHEFCHSRCE
jgi:hypothetical protein